MSGVPGRHPPRVLIVAESLEPTGGGPAIAAWTIEALKAAYEITVVTWAPVDLVAVNRFYGTSIGAGDVRVRAVPAVLRRSLAAIGARAAMLRMAIIVATARRLAPAFDVLLSSDAEMDLGRRAIQYVNLPGRLPWQGLPRPLEQTRWYHRFAAPYFRLVDRLAPTSTERIRQNLTLVNSDWTGSRLRAALGIDGATVYPPAAGDFEDVPWASREAAFVCIGRLAGHKMMHQAVDALAAVRVRRPDIRLHVVSPSRGDPDSRHELLSRLDAAREWATLHQNLSRPALARLVSRCRYGIHPMSGEPFGMAVAELVRAGCIPWVRRQGGPCEIVGGDERLLWDTSAEAADKILRVLDDAATEGDLRARLARRSRDIGPERFMERMRATVDRLLAAPHGR